ncbi:1-acyl-sn-glycerol-3-phosphate acyltransferase [Rhodococcus fascians]|nr:1-acyl-sn-glycerol-3-phosphate acyltransferase [Rhodococcus fascians]MBY4237876.1 1-acyl-sn-glycerol-3-phosphate acyltransferase [Rhodococcus fascians]MBY4253373.1 1-acyl-sn-glycerol-3-phosphate acyltransferase [Rhodococcus fascians]MBY4269010.1 1-acyl-sn-glycerol-3-phosphate acyltransferase [Rhodococcus fascians]MBY4275063.1 1-acyl-sn-glycerol-3-phosphate acyltransferase [Rhodococcus fascians]
MKTIPRMLRTIGVEAVRRYNRLVVTVAQPLPDRPVLFVANHGFGGIVDLNLLAFAAAYDDMGSTRELTALTHQMVWSLRVGGLVEPFGARPANRREALGAFRAGGNVLVFPGGDTDALKSWTERNEIVFSGRCGFARLAMEADVPVVPVVTAGAGETLYAASSGRRLASALGVDKALRLSSLPVTVSIPWGINIGFVGLLPYFPLPSKLKTSVLAPMEARDGETAEIFAARIEKAMQVELNRLTKNRIPILG